MDKKLMNIRNSLNTLAVVICLGVVPILGAGCAGDRYHESTGESIDDMATTARVKKALGDNPDYKFGDVKVTTFKGVVQLGGFVNSPEQKTTAGMIAARVEGAKQIENQISLKP